MKPSILGLTLVALLSCRAAALVLGGADTEQDDETLEEQDLELEEQDEEAELMDEEMDQEMDDEMDEEMVEEMLSTLPAGFNISRLGILTALQSFQNLDAGSDVPYDCAKYPHMCKEPFNCGSWTHQDTINLKMKGIATEDGHANLRSWCMPGLERYADGLLKECIVKKNLRASAQLTLRRTFKDYADELDASYCFAEGHCTNRVVTDWSSVEDSEKMCDFRFGHRVWTGNFVKNLKRLIALPRAFASLASTKAGFRSQRVTRVLSKLACAQGVFHCDVMYCKHTYCRDEYYVSKYSSLLPPIPGNLMRDGEHSSRTDDPDAEDAARGY